MDIKTIRGFIFLYVRDGTALKFMKSFHNKSNKAYLFPEIYLRETVKVLFAYCCHPHKNTLASTWNNSEK